MPSETGDYGPDWDVNKYLVANNNWGRWGKDDQKGAVNLITPDKIRSAAQLVRDGENISLSRRLPTQPGPGNPFPAQHYVIATEPGNPTQAGSSVDYYGFRYHGHSYTHVDALCHTWSQDVGMWNGRKASANIGLGAGVGLDDTPPEKFTSLPADGVRWADVSQWSDGITTRGVLLDIPALRGTCRVEADMPVEGSELRAAAQRQGVVIEPGDALVVYCGREHWEDDAAGRTYTRSVAGGRPGLDASCIPVIRETDIAVLLWDMLDAHPNKYGIGSTVHNVLWAFGVGLVDNCLLGRLRDACVQRGRYEFMLLIAPLVVIGGTGSPVNPIAIL
jgi:kynurenine formamidase